jgi:hypothetical protein
MRCCGSPITSTAPDPGSGRAQSLQIAAQFEALLLKEAFTSLATAIGFYGDAVVEAAAHAMTSREGDGLTGPLERAIEAANRGTAGR